jgi:hypothetical protein
MPVGAAKPVALGFIGVAKESTPGTAVAATNYIPMTKFDPYDNQRWLDDLGWRGSMATEYGEIQGVVATENDLGGDVFADSVGWLVAGILGDVTTTGASAPFTHAISLKNSGDGQPTSYTYTDFYGRTDSNPARQYPASKVLSFTLKGTADGLLTWEAKTNGFASAVAAKPTAAFTAVTASPAYECVASIGGSASAIVEDFEIDLVRQGGPIFNVDGDKTPYEIFAGKIGVAGKLTTIMETDLELNRFVGATAGTTALDFNAQHGASSTLVQVLAHMSQAQYTVAKIVRGKEYVTVEIDYKAVANTTDAGASGGLSPCKITLQNALAASTYV